MTEKSDDEAGFVRSMVVMDDGSVILGGQTEGDWAMADADGSTDFAAAKVDQDGVEIWRWQASLSTRRRIPARQCNRTF